MDSDFKKSYIHVKFKQYDLPMKIFLLAAVFLIGILFSAQQRMSEKKIEELKVSAYSTRQYDEDVIITFGNYFIDLYTEDLKNFDYLKTL